MANSFIIYFAFVYLFILEKLCQLTNLELKNKILSIVPIKYIDSYLLIGLQEME
jgi:hypothetical protein